MMNRAAKRGLGILCGAVLVPGILLFAVHQAATRTVRRHEAAISTLLSELQINGTPRPGIFGDPLPGRGWDLYAEASDAVAALPQDERGLITPMEFMIANPDDDQLAGLWAKQAPVVGLLRRAVRCPDQSRSALMNDRRLERSNVVHLLRGGSGPSASHASRPRGLRHRPGEHGRRPRHAGPELRRFRMVAGDRPAGGGGRVDPPVGTFVVGAGSRGARRPSRPP